MTRESQSVPSPFNGPLEMGLRALVVLDELYPANASLDRLVILDYLVVHSDDIPGGPKSLHPRIPNRSGELLVRRESLQAGLRLFGSRRLICQTYEPTGVRYSASETSTWFLDAIDADYVHELRQRAEWLIQELGSLADDELQSLATQHLGEWGAEFATQSVLWAEETQ